MAESVDSTRSVDSVVEGHVQTVVSRSIPVGGILRMIEPGKERPPAYDTKVRQRKTVDVVGRYENVAADLFDAREKGKVAFVFVLEVRDFQISVYQNAAFEPIPEESIMCLRPRVAETVDRALAH